MIGINMNEFRASIIVMNPNDTTGMIPETQNTMDFSRSFKIVGGDPNASSTLYLDVNKMMSGLEVMEQRESLLIEAVRNYIKKLNFDELNESLDDEVISQDEYDNELNMHEHKYAITFKDINSPGKVGIIIDLVNKIGIDLRDFSTSEVAEMFSVKENQLLSYINPSLYPLK